MALLRNGLSPALHGFFMVADLPMRVCQIKAGIRHLRGKANAFRKPLHRRVDLPFVAQNHT